MFERSTPRRGGRREPLVFARHFARLCDFLDLVFKIPIHSK